MSKAQLIRIYTLHRLLATMQTIPSCQLRSRLNVSRATLFRDIELLKSIDAPIKYSYLWRGHYYSTEFILSREELLEYL